ncbi:hypothetical protein ACHAO9_012485 [Fusarium lateritium]
MDSAEKKSVDNRIDRLERTIGALVDRLNSLVDEPSGSSNQDMLPALQEPGPSTELDPAPLFMIRDAAADAGVYSPDQANTQAGSRPDVISSGHVSLPTAYSLLQLYDCLSFGKIQIN